MQQESLEKSLTCTEEQLVTFVSLLKTQLPDNRDNRGKRHSLVVIIVGFVLATLIGRSQLSGAHRYICNKVSWLHDLVQIPETKPISRAHLPRVLNRLDLEKLNELIWQCLGIKIGLDDQKQWYAIDGKVLRGTLKSGEKQRVVLAVKHETRETVACAPQCGDKSSEIPVVRTLLKEAKLETQKISLDAHHFNPATTEQIHQAGGMYLIQAKENQPHFVDYCQEVVEKSPKLAEICQHEKNHGRVTTRHIGMYALDSSRVDKRWQQSGLSVLMTVERETYYASTQKTTRETSYYVSNSALKGASISALGNELKTAIRHHWKVESNNWIRDVTFKEDNIKTKAENQTQVSALLRTLAI
ncbi:MAG: ISAs1 family transposase, partial [Gammaproteobacteria bacterium]